MTKPLAAKDNNGSNTPGTSGYVELFFKVLIAFSAGWDFVHFIPNLSNRFSFKFNADALSSTLDKTSFAFGNTAVTDIAKVQKEIVGCSNPFNHFFKRFTEIF